MAKVFLAVGMAVDLGQLSNLTNTARKISDSSCFIASNEKRGMLDFWNNVSGKLRYNHKNQQALLRLGTFPVPYMKLLTQVSMFQLSMFQLLFKTVKNKVQ